MLLRPTLKKLMSFRRDESGGLTVEGVMWLPIYAVFIALIADVSIMFNSQTQVQRAVQDMNRLASSGFYLTEEEIEARVALSLSHLSQNVTVDAQIDETNHTIVTLASIPAKDVMAIGIIGIFGNIQLSAGAQHLIES